MSKQLSSLSVVLGMTVAPFVSGLTVARNALGGFTGAIGSAGLSVVKLTGLAGGVGAVFAAIKGAATGISLAAELEQNAVAFETMLGSAEAAKGMLASLTAFASSTPFQFPEIAAAAKKLLAFGVGASSITDKLKMLGDIAAGTGKPLGDLAAIYGKIKSRGQLTGETLNQLAEAGVPIYRALAASLGTNESAIAGLVTAGTIGFPQVDAALQTLTATGGQFSGLMEKQSHTLAGLWSTLTDNIGLACAGLVTTVVNAFGLREALAAFTSGVGRIGDVVNTFVSTYAPLVVAAAKRVWSAIVGVASAIYSYVAPIAQQIGSVIAANWQSVAASTINLFVSLYQSVVSMFAPIAAAVMSSGLTMRQTLEGVGIVVGVVVAAFALWRSSGLITIAAQYALATASGVASLAMSGVSAAAYVVAAAQTALSTVVAGASLVWTGLTAAYGLLTTALTAGPAIFAAISAAIEGATIASVAASVASGVWTAAQWVLNAALTANPIGIVIVAIGGLVVWLATVVDWTSVFSSALGYLKSAAAIASTAMSNLGLSAQIVGVAVAYMAAKIGNEIAYTFTIVIPAYLGWFGKNWRQVFTDAASFTATTFVNMARNIGNFFAAVKSFASGKGFAFNWTPLTDGFKATMSELPQIAARQAGPLEQQLGAKLGDLTGKFKDAMAKANATVPTPTVPTPTVPTANVGADAVKSITDQIAGAKPPEIAAPVIPTAGITAATDAMDDLNKSTDKAAKSFDTLGFNSAAAMAEHARARFDANIVPLGATATPGTATASTSSTPSVSPLPRQATAAIAAASAAKTNKPGSGTSEDMLLTAFLDFVRFYKANPSALFKEA